MAADLTLWAGRTLHGSDRFGEWITTETDWWDSPDVKGESEDRPNADGEYDLPIYNQARLINFTGHLHTAGHTQTHEAMNYLTGAMAGRIQVSGHGVTQWAEAKRNGGVKFTPITDTFAQWQVRLKCVDPLKYGDANKFTIGSAYEKVFHYGNTVGYPVIVVSGSAPGGYVLQSSAGAEYRVTTPLVSGSPHTIDMSTGLLVRNGLAVSGGVTRADLWRVPGGSGATDLRVLPITTGSPTASVTLLDTYI